MSSCKALRPRSFMEQFREQMHLRGVNQTELARRLGCTKANVHNLLNRQQHTNEATMHRLAQAIGSLVVIALLPPAPEVTK